ncbi:MAG TPA: enoyl-CoA hydratase-related protein [Bordetella sp.]
MAGDILIDIDGGIAILRLSSPSRRNAISASMWRTLRNFAVQANRMDDLRAVVVRGDGERIFSAGADIGEFDAARSGADTRAYDDLVESACAAVEAIDRPTLAAIAGPCVGAGVSLAASCDLRIASQDASFSVPAARLGLGYDPRGVARLMRVFGPALTRSLLYTADRIAVRDAGASAILRIAESAQQVAADALVLAQRIAANAPLTLRAAKAAVRAAERGEAACMQAALEAAALADASADYTEGRKAFAEKRPPNFRGT